jgi:phosphoribosylformylglycinamidine cyclo-ligase
LQPVQQLWQAGVNIHGLAHITGGGIVDNLPRILPDGVGAIIRRGTWREPPIFKLIQSQGDISTEEMFHVFNMGLGMLVIIPPGQVSLVQDTLPGDSYLVGKIEEGETEVKII